MDVNMEALIPWQDLVEEALVGHPKFMTADILTIIWMESRGDPNAVNPESGAVGLMQVMPREAGPEFADRPTREELKNPKTNITWGVKILAYYCTQETGIWGGLYQYSGGLTWDGLNEYALEYWQPFVEIRDQIQAALEE